MRWHFSERLGRFYYPGEDLRHLIASGMARKAAISALSLFSPIYVYQSFVGFNYDTRTSLLAGVGFFLLMFLGKLPTLLLAENLSQKAGFKGVLRLSAVPFLFFIPSIIFASKYLYLFPISAILWGVHAGFFWWGYHGYFVKSGEPGHFGTSIGEMNLADTFVSIITPLAGALVVGLLGFDFLFLFSGVLVLISQYLLGRDHDKKQKRDIRVRDVVELIIRHKEVAIAYSGSSAQSVVYSVAWPIFLFLFFGKVVNMGAIVSLAALMSSLFAVAVGGWFDKKGAASSVLLGSPLTVTAWLLRFFGHGFGAYVFADSLWNFGERMVAIPLGALTYTKGKESGTGAAVLFREVSLLFGDFVAILLMIIFVVSGIDIPYIFILAALFAILPAISAAKKSLN